MPASSGEKLCTMPAVLPGLLSLGTLSWHRADSTRHPHLEQAARASGMPSLPSRLCPSRLSRLCSCSVCVSTGNPTTESEKDSMDGSSLSTVKQMGQNPDPRSCCLASQPMFMVLAHFACRFICSPHINLLSDCPEREPRPALGS